MEIEELIDLLGLNLPRILTINMIAGMVKDELRASGRWDRARDYGFFIPLAVGAAICWFSGERGIDALWCGGLYGAAAIALHEFGTRM